MYRNYNGVGSAFGDLSVPAISGDQEKLSIYAARRSQDGRLTLMVINKSSTTLDSAINISGFSPTSNAEVYRYSATNLTAIVHLPDQTVGASFVADFPANSITLFVLSPLSGGGSSEFIYLPLILRQ